MDGAENLVESDAMAHGGDVLGDQVARMFAGDGDAEDFVLAGDRQHLDQAVRFRIRDGAVQVVDAVGRDFVGNLLFLRLDLVQSDVGDFRFGERGPGNDGVVGAEFLQAAEQRIDRRIPGLVRCRVGELVRPRHIAAGIDVWINRLQEFVGFDRAAFRCRDAQCFEPIAFRVGDAPDGDQYLVEGDADLAALVLANQDFFSVLHDEARGFVC